MGGSEGSIMNWVYCKRNRKAVNLDFVSEIIFDDHHIRLKLQDNSITELHKLPGKDDLEIDTTKDFDRLVSTVMERLRL